MTDELKPCPFCGKPPNIWNHRSEFGISNICDVYCKQDNHSVIVTGNSKEEAFIAWNARHEPDELPEWVKEAIEKKIGYFNSDKHNWTLQMRDGLLFGLQWVLSLRNMYVR